jgi:CPA2 family monovalent cation:H+ antiporter-2
VEHLLPQLSLLVAVLGAAAAASLFLRMPVVPLYILAGVVLGVWFERNEVVELLGTLGIVFLLFSMGLEMSVDALVAAPRRFLTAGTWDLVFNFPVGLLIGWLLGWSWLASLFLAGILYMSSSAVVAKCIADFGRAVRPETETILHVMVYEDLIIAALLVVLGVAMAAGDDAVNLREMALVAARAGGFVVVLLAAAFWMRGGIATLLGSRSAESFTLVLVAFVLLVASGAMLAGLSEAIGAFLAGLAVGGTPLKERAAHTLTPLQTLFAALFFVSFGMSLDPASLLAVALPATGLVVLGLLSKTAGGYVAGRSAGFAKRPALVVGLSLVPKGEFSIVLAGMAAAATSAEVPLAALVGLYVLALSVIGPLLMRQADAIALRVFPPAPPAA